METADRKWRVLFLCTGNSCRSQMAEGWANALHSKQVEAHSAGTSPHGLNPRAVQAMREAGVDISAHRSKHIDEFKNIDLDCIVTVCDSAAESCPVFSSATMVIHRSFDDPPKLALHAVNEEDAMIPYRRVRDEIRSFIAELPIRLAEVLDPVLRKEVRNEP